MHDVYLILDEVLRATPERLRALRVNELLERKGEKYDSHPPPADRIARVEGIPPTRAADDTPARELFRDSDKRARELTARVLEKVDAYLVERGQERAGPVEVEPVAEAKLAAAIAYYEDVLELLERKEPGSEALLPEAVARLEGQLPPGDPLVLPALSRLARAKAQGGDRPGAEELLVRAIGLAEASPGGRERVAAIKEQLDELRKAA